MPSKSQGRRRREVFVLMPLSQRCSTAIVRREREATGAVNSRRQQGYLRRSMWQQGTCRGGKGKSTKKKVSRDLGRGRSDREPERGVTALRGLPGRLRIVLVCLPRSVNPPHLVLSCVATQTQMSSRDKPFFLLLFFFLHPNASKDKAHDIFDN